MKNVLEMVKKDYEKQGHKTYSLLYSLMELLPYDFISQIHYNESKDSLSIGTINIGDLYDVVAIYDDSDPEEDEIYNCSTIAIKFERLDLNTGEVYKTKRVIFYYDRENNCHTFKDNAWIDEEDIEEDFPPIGEGDMAF